MEEMKNLNTTLKYKTTSSVWISLNRGNTGRWLWSLADGDLYREGSKYRNWYSGQPKTSPNSGSYIFINSLVKWREAQSYCRVNYTDLVSVRNQTENGWVRTSVHNYDEKYFWIGLFNDSWQWSDQSYSSFRYWASTQPDDTGGSQNCTAVSMTEGDAGGSWFNENCDSELPFVCREDQLVLVNLTLTWKDALRYCREHHVDLVSVHSGEVQSGVMEVAQKASTAHVWLGLRHTCTLSFWFWVSGFSLCYQNWAPGNGTGGEDCGSGERSGAGQPWVSLPETQTLNFICSNY
ncbi:C-type mannose receptor 2-like [Hoplias malabaricus]|uniref:C-type mannose receptor 2-like n=1 Tax=Hoplias malabaricus TaxID=27720 RepID=UPI00346376E1